MRRGALAACALLAVAGAVDAQPNPPRATIVRDLRIDGAAEDFSFVGGLHVGPSGQMAVRLPQDYQVRLYDSAGKQIARAGRRGSGPGEFESPVDIMWLGDTLVLHESDRKRLAYFAPNGSLLRAPLVPTVLRSDPSAAGVADTTYSFFMPLAFQSGGTMLGLAHLRLRSRSSPAPPTRAIVAWTAARGPQVVAELPDPLDPPWQITIGGSSSPVPFAFHPQTVAARGGGRFAHLTSVATSAGGGEFTVQLVDAGGKIRYARTFPYRAAPIPRRAIDSAIAAMAPRGEVADGSPGAARLQAIARDRMPPSYAGVVGVRLGFDNTVWIELAPTRSERTWLVLNAHGDPVASVAFPANVYIRAVSATRAWGIEYDADEMGSIVRYRVNGISCGAVPC